MSGRPDEIGFERWTDKQAKVHGIDMPRYYLSGLQPHTVDPRSQKAWYENAELCVRRDLTNLFVGERVNINGHIVERIVKGKHGERYLIGGAKLTFAEALALVCAEREDAG